MRKKKTTQKDRKIFVAGVILIVILVQLFILAPDSAGAATSTLSCNKVEYKAGNNTTCTFYTDTPLIENYSYGVFWFLDVPQDAITYNWKLIQALELGQTQKSYWLGTVGNRIKPAVVQRTTGKDLQTKGFEPASIPTSSFTLRTDGVIKNNTLVILQRIGPGLGGEETLLDKELARASTTIEFTIPQGETITIGIKPSGSAVLARLFSLTFIRDGNVITKNEKNETIEVTWDFGDGEGTYKEPITKEFQHTFPSINKYKVVAKFTINGVEKRAEQEIDISTTTETTLPPSSDEGLIGVIMSTVNIILGFVIALLRWIIHALGSVVFVPLLETTLSIEASNITSTIVEGWTYVRDLVNMLFILILIIIGFGTMLKLESYSYKKLLVRLLVMAMLVNFSLVIGRVIIQIADAAQFTFLPEGAGIAGVKDLYQKLMTSQIPGIIDGFLSTSRSQALMTTFSLIFQLIFELGVVLTFGALAVFMLIRTVAVFILLIISPFAYALTVLPATAGMAKKWWSTFMKYAFFAPIIAFFLKLTSVIYTKAFQFFPSTTFSPAGNTLPNDFRVYLGQLGVTSKIDFSVALQLVIIYVVILAFLWAGLIATKQMGIFGANAIVGLAEKGLKAPLAGGWKATKFGGRALDKWLAKGAEKKGTGLYNAMRRAGSYLSPGAWKRGWEERKKHKEFEAYTEAAGARADLFNRVISRERTDHRLRAQQARVNEELGKISTKNREELAMHYEEALKEGNAYKAMAFANRMAQNYDLNELLSFRHYETTHEGLQEMIKKDLIPLLGEQTAYRAGYDLSRMAEEVMHWNYSRAFTGKYEPESKEIKYEINPEAARECEIELSKMGRRDQVGRGNRLAWGIRETNLETGERVDMGWNDFGKDRWKAEVADTEFRNQFNINAAMHILTKHSKEAVQRNKVAWLNLVDTKAAKLTPEQLEQWRLRVSRPVAGWEKTEEEGQTYKGMETVERYINEGLIAEKDIKELFGGTNSNLYQALTDYRRMQGSSGQAAQTPPPRTPPSPPPPQTPPLTPPAPPPQAGPSPSQTPPQAPRGIADQIANQFIQQGLPSQAHSSVREVIREFHSGDTNIEGMEKKLSGFVNAATATTMASRVADEIALHKVSSADQGVFSSIPGIDPQVLREAVRLGVREGFATGAKLGSAAIADRIAAKIRDIAPGVARVDDYARDIASEINRPEKH